MKGPASKAAAILFPLCKLQNKSTARTCSGSSFVGLYFLKCSPYHHAWDIFEDEKEYILFMNYMVSLQASIIHIVISKTLKTNQFVLILYLVYMDAVLRLIVEWDNFVLRLL